MYSYKEETKARTSAFVADTNAKKRQWVKQIYMSMESEGEFHTLVQFIRKNDHEHFFKYMRMSAETFDELLSLVDEQLRRLV